MEFSNPANNLPNQTQVQSNIGGALLNNMQAFPGQGQNEASYEPLPSQPQHKEEPVRRTTKNLSTSIINEIVMVFEVHRLVFKAFKIMITRAVGPM